MLRYYLKGQFLGLSIKIRERKELSVLKGTRQEITKFDI
jgi:hypothetical protein